MIVVPLLALPVALQLVAADGVPQLDVTQSCRGAAEAGYVASTAERLQMCIASEHGIRDQLDKTWSSFPASDRNSCLSSVKGFAPTYSELVTCLEMKRDVANMGARNADTVTAPSPPSPSTSGTGSTSPTD